MAYSNSNMPIMLVLSDITLVQADGLRSHTYITKYLCRKNIMYSPGGGGLKVFKNLGKLGNKLTVFSKIFQVFFENPNTWQLGTGHPTHSVPTLRDLHWSKGSCRQRLSWKE